MNNNVVNFPWNSISDDRLYNAEDVAAVFKSLLTNGVVTEQSGEPGLGVTTDGTSMDVTIAPGCLICNGRAYVSSENQSLTVSAADTSLNRLDSVVLELNVAQRTTILKVLTGTPVSVPSPIQLTRTSDVYQMELAQIFVPAGSTMISASNIIDTRSNSNRCGLITKGILDSTAVAELQRNVSKLITANTTQTDSNGFNYKIDYNSNVIELWGIWPTQSFDAGTSYKYRALPVIPGYKIDIDSAAVQLTAAGFAGSLFLAGNLGHNAASTISLVMAVNNTNSSAVTSRVFYNIKAKLIQG